MPSPSHQGALTGHPNSQPPAYTAQLNARLRQPPSAHTVPGALPILCFGDLLTARVVTIGLNPSWHEYLDDQRQELTGDARRFETLSSLGASSREALTAAQCAQAIAQMRRYFQPQQPIYPWFAHLDRVSQAARDACLQKQLVHLDLVQEATDPTWSALQHEAPEESKGLLTSGLRFLSWVLSAYPIQLALCNGRTAFQHVSQLCQARIMASDHVRRITWWVGAGQLGRRPITVAGWTLPLDKPTGLTGDDEVRLGWTMTEQIDRM